MADNSKFVQAQKFLLAGSGVTLSETSITLQKFKFPADNTGTETNIAITDFGDIGYGVLEPNTANEEAISFTGVTQNADGTATLTGVTRGLKFNDDYTGDNARRFAHAGGTTFIITNSAVFYSQFAVKDNDETVTGTWTFSVSAFPAMSDTTTNPVDDGDLAPKHYVDSAGGGSPTNINRTVVTGTAGATVAAGQVVYLDETDNEWKLADASSAATSDNVQLGIAQGAGTDGSAITGGVLIYGRDSNQSGLTQGDRLYISDTAGGVVNSAGTVEVEIGHAVSATTMDFVPKFASYTTALQREALVGTSGTPSTSNKYVTNDDTSATSSADKVVRADSNGEIDDSYLALTTAGDLVYRDGTNIDRLAIGTKGQILSVNSGATAPQWQTMNGVGIFGDLYGLVIPANSNGGWTLTGATYTVNFPGEAQIESSGATWGAIAPLRGDGSGALAFSGSKRVIVEFMARIDSNAAGDWSVGLTDAVTSIDGAYNDNTGHRATFGIDGSTLYSVSVDGSTAETNDISSGITVTNWNFYRIEFDPTVDVKYFVNGTLKATHSSNIPTTGNISVGFGGSDNTDDWIFGPIYVAFEY